MKRDRNTGKIRAEAFDILQYFYKTVHDPIIRCVVSFSGHIDGAALKKAVTVSSNAIPQVRCCFDLSARRPYWRDTEFTGDDIVSIVESAYGEKRLDSLLASSIDIEHEPQLKIYVLRETGADTLCILINHMVCDGAGFKEYLYMLAGLYTDCLAGKNVRVPDYYGRGFWPLFNRLTPMEKAKTLFNSYDLARQKQYVHLPLEGDNENPFLVVRRISRENMLLVKTYAKDKGATLNDMFLTAYIRLLGRKTGEGRIILPCPVDLRKYVPPGWKHGICNLTSNLICDVSLVPEGSFEDTLKKVSGQMREQKNGYSCLKPLINMELVFSLLPFKVLQKNFSRIFKIPVVSYSNLGIVDQDSFCFGDASIRDAYLTAAVKRTPYFQVSVSTFDGGCTFSCNFHGTANDKAWIRDFLLELETEMLEQVKS